NEDWSPAPTPTSQPEPVYEEQDHGHDEQEDGEEEEEDENTADERQVEDDRIGESSTYETEDEEIPHSSTSTTEGGSKWSTYDRRNAWDTVEGIHEYVSLLQSRGRSASKSKKTGHFNDDDSDEEE